jgi:hypothetical protein
VLEDGVGRESVVPPLRVELGGAGEDVQQIGPVVVRRGRLAAILPRPSPERLVADATDRAPAVRPEDVVPRGPADEVVAGSAGFLSSLPGGGRLARRGVGHLVERPRQVEQILPFLRAERDDRPERAALEGVRSSRFVDGAAGRRDDDVAALGPRLDQRLDLVIRVLHLGWQLRSAGELVVPADLRAVVQPVDAAGGPLEVAVLDTVNQLAPAEIAGGRHELVVTLGGIEVDRLEVVADPAADDADARMRASGVPLVDLVFIRARRVILSPSGDGGCLRSILERRYDPQAEAVAEKGGLVGRHAHRFDPDSPNSNRALRDESTASPSNRSR